MAEFYTAVTTNAGIALETQTHAESKRIEFTKMKVGSGDYAEAEAERTELQKATGLKQQNQEFFISTKTAVSETCVLLKAIFTNKELTEGYRITEIGVFAKKEGEEGDGILYSMCVAKEADYFPRYNGLAPCEIIQEYYITVSNEADVTITAGSGAPALAEDLEKLWDEVRSRSRVLVGPVDTPTEPGDIILVLDDDGIDYSNIQLIGTAPDGAELASVRNPQIVDGEIAVGDSETNEIKGV